MEAPANITYFSFASKFFAIFLRIPLVFPFYSSKNAHFCLQSYPSGFVSDRRESEEYRGDEEEGADDDAKRFASIYLAERVAGFLLPTAHRLALIIFHIVKFYLYRCAIAAIFF